MPYRTPPEAPRTDPHELREIAALAAEARQRHRRAGIAVGSVVTGGLFALVAVFCSAAPAPRVVCHRVELRWENAPEAPASSWTACETR